MIYIQWTYSGPRGLRDMRAVRAAQKAAWLAIATIWHQNLRPKHFTHAGAREYAYDKRQGEVGSGRPFKGSYTARKLRLFGHTLPLVWSGASRTRSAIRNIKSTSKGARVTMNVPTLNFRKGRNAKGKSMREELTTVSLPERKALANYLGRVFTNELQRDRVVVRGAA